MDIGFLWHDEKYEQVKAKHGISYGEVVDVFDDEDTMYDRDPRGDPDRMMAVGETRGGRLLQIIFTYEDAPLIRIITAFEASKEWQDEYRR